MPEQPPEYTPQTGHHVRYLNPTDAAGRRPAGVIADIAGDRALIFWDDLPFGASDVPLDQLVPFTPDPAEPAGQPTAPRSVAEIRRAVVAGCGGGAMLYPKAEQLVDEFADAVRADERRRVGAGFAAAARVAHKAEGETDAARLLTAAARVEAGFAIGGSCTTEAVVRLLRYTSGFLDGVQDALGRELNG